MVFGEFANQLLTQQIVAKRDGATAATQDYDFYVTSAPLICLADGVTTSQFAYDYRGAKSLGVTVADGGIPNFYGNGGFVGIGNNALDVDDDGNTLRIGEHEGGTNRLQSPLGCVLIYVDKVLTDEQIAQLDEAWRRVRVGKGPRRFRRLPGPNLNGAVLDIAGDRLPDGNFPENIQGLNGVPSGNVMSPRGASGMRCPAFYGTDEPRVDIPSDTSYTTPNLVSYMFALRYRTTGSGAFGRLWTLNSGGIAYSTLLANAAGFLYQCTFTDGLAVWTTPVLPDGRDYVITLIHDRTTGGNLPRILVDDEELVVTVSTAKVGNLMIPAGANLRLGNRPDGLRPCDSNIGPFRFWDKLLSEAERRQELVQMNNRPEHLTRRFRQSVSLAAVAPNDKAGPWEVLSGTHRWDDDGTRRRLLCVTAGGTVATQPYAHGAYYFRMLKALDASTTRVMFVANARETYGGATVDGYHLEISAGERLWLQRVLNGVATSNVILTAAGFVAVNTEYEMFIARRSRDNRFQLWIRGGAFTSWTSVGTGTDSTYTSSSFITTDIDAGDTVTDFIVFPLGAGLLPTDVFPDA
jgi:hypothetical protein